MNDNDNIFDFHIKLNNIELRERNDKFEIVKWFDEEDKPFCIVLSFCYFSPEGYDIKSVGMRPWELEDDDFDDYNTVVKMFYRVTELKIKYDRNH